MLNFSWSEDSTSLEGVETWVDKTRSSVVWIHCWSWFELEVWPDDFAKSLPAWINLWLIHQKEKYFCLHCNLFKDISCQFFSILLPPDLNKKNRWKHRIFHQPLCYHCKSYYIYVMPWHVVLIKGAQIPEWIHKGIETCFDPVTQQHLGTNSLF